MSTDGSRNEVDPLAPVFYDEPVDHEAADAADPLAAVHYDDGAAPETDEPLVVGVDGLDAEFDESGDGGVSDPDQALRVWVTDRRITKLTLSQHWARRLGRKPLSEAFGQALFLANHQPRAAVEVSDPPTFDPAIIPAEPTFASVDAVMDALKDLSALEVEAAERLTTRGAVQARSGGVNVSLDQLGNVAGVDFDPQWLERARTDEVVDRVLRTAAQAQEKYTTAGGDAGLGDVDDTRAWLLSVLDRMMPTKENSDV